MSLVGISLEDVGRSVGRVVVGSDDEVDSRGEMEGDVLIDDVGLVAYEQCHDELHRRAKRK
jgi:hypothetical protein